MRVKGNILADNIGQATGTIRFTDGANTYPTADELNFNNNDFYLSRDLGGDPVLNMNDRFKGCLARMDTNNSLSTGVGELLTFTEELYDIGNWFTGPSGSSFTVPANVYRVIAFVRILVATTGTPANVAEMFGSFLTITVLNNSIAIPTGGTAVRTILNSGNTTISFSTAPLPVYPGDVLTFQVTATFPGSGITAVSVTAANTYAGAYEAR